MNKKSYENLTLPKLLILLVFLMEIIFFLILKNYKIYNYKKYACIVTNKNICLLIINKKEKNILYKNSSLYLENKLKKYKILEDNDVIITKGREKYNEVLISFKFNNSKTNDVLKIVFKNKKESLINIFKLIWDGDNN